MTQSLSQILQIEPKSGLVFEGPFTSVITSYIRLTNPTENVVGFKVKTTVPKCYCVRPSSGYIEPQMTIDVAVMLQPINYNPYDRFNHKFMIQSIIAETPRPELEQLWKTSRDKIMESRLLCILKIPNELTVEPNRDLIFEGPPTKSLSSVVTLTNDLAENMRYVISSQSQNFLFEPASGVVNEHSKVTVTVTFNPENYVPEDKNRERIIIRSYEANNAKSKDDDMVSIIKSKYFKVTDDSVNGYPLKCVFKALHADEKVEHVKSPLQTSKPIVHEAVSNKHDTARLLAEIAALRQENASLKESDLHLRRSMLADPCRTQFNGTENITPSGNHNTSFMTELMMNAPPILYLVLSLIFGLIIGRFVL